VRFCISHVFAIVQKIFGQKPQPTLLTRGKPDTDADRKQTSIHCPQPRNPMQKLRRLHRQCINNEQKFKGLRHLRTPAGETLRIPPGHCREYSPGFLLLGGFACCPARRHPIGGPRTRMFPASEHSSSSPGRKSPGVDDALSGHVSQGGEGNARADPVRVVFMAASARPVSAAPSL